MTNTKRDELKAALEWARSFYSNMEISLNDHDCPREIKLAASALQIIITELSRPSAGGLSVAQER